MWQDIKINKLYYKLQDMKNSANLQQTRPCKGQVPQPQIFETIAENKFGPAYQFNRFTKKSQILQRWTPFISVSELALQMHN